MPAHAGACWYWANVTRPRVLQAAEPPQTVTISGQTMTPAEAAVFCADPANAEACLAAAREAGITPELPPEYTAVARELGVVVRDPLRMMEEAMARYRAAAEAEQHRLEAVVLERLPRERLNPAFAALKRLQEAGLNVTTISEAAQACHQKENFVVCHATAVAVGIPEGGFKGAFGDIVSAFARQHRGALAGRTVDELRQEWERIPEDARRQVLEEAERRFAEHVGGREDAADIPPEARRCTELTYPERAECFKAIFRGEIVGIPPEAQRCTELPYPQRRECFMNLARRRDDDGRGRGEECERLPYPERAECFKGLFPGGEGQAVPNHEQPAEEEAHRRFEEGFRSPFGGPPEDGRPPESWGGPYPGDGRPTNRELYERARREGRPVPEYEEMFRREGSGGFSGDSPRDGSSFEGGHDEGSGSPPSS